MSHFDNAATKLEQERTDIEYWDGVDEGYHANVNQLPEWWFKVTAGRMTARQRGYFVGREMQVQDIRGDE